MECQCMIELESFFGYKTMNNLSIYLNIVHKLQGEYIGRHIIVFKLNVNTVLQLRFKRVKSVCFLFI